MNKKIIVVILFIAVIGLMASPTHAFWPFDGRGGQVKGEQTEVQSDTERGGIIQDVLRRFGMGSKPSSSAGQRGMMGSGAQGMMPPGGMGMEGQFTEERLSKAVTDGKITAEQKSEILSRVNEIKVKREEIQTMEQSLKTWLTDNNISLGMMGGSGAKGMRPPQDKMPGRGTGTSRPPRSTGSAGAQQ